MSEQVERLRDRSVVELTPQQANRLVQKDRLHEGRRYYLVRSSIYGEFGDSYRQLVDYVDAASFHLWYLSNGQAYLATAQPTNVPGLRAHNIALVINTDVEINHLTVGCYAIP